MMNKRKETFVGYNEFTDYQISSKTSIIDPRAVWYEMLVNVKDAKTPVDFTKCTPGRSGSVRQRCFRDMINLGFIRGFRACQNGIEYQRYAILPTESGKLLANYFLKIKSVTGEDSPNPILMRILKRIKEEPGHDTSEIKRLDGRYYFTNAVRDDLVVKGLIHFEGKGLYPNPLLDEYLEAAEEFFCMLRNAGSSIGIEFREGWFKKSTENFSLPNFWMRPEPIDVKVPWKEETPIMAMTEDEYQDYLTTIKLKRQPYAQV